MVLCYVLRECHEDVHNVWRRRSQEDQISDKKCPMTKWSPISTQLRDIKQSWRMPSEDPRGREAFALILASSLPLKMSFLLSWCAFSFFSLALFACKGRRQQFDYEYPTLRPIVLYCLAAGCSPHTVHAQHTTVGERAQYLLHSNVPM